MDDLGKKNTISGNLQMRYISAQSDGFGGTTMFKQTQKNMPRMATGHGEPATI